MDEHTLDASPPAIDPYQVLGLEAQATADQVKSAYRKKALKHHPDKATQEAKVSANAMFQEITFAYSILSDSRRRSRYDATGNIAESLDDDDGFDWKDFFRSQKAEMVDDKAIERIKSEYQHSDDEKVDLLAAYEHYEGNMDAVYGDVMCSSVLEDDQRFREIIDEAIKKRKVCAWRKYTEETRAKKSARLEKAKAEEFEAREYAEELGVAEQLFGHRKKYADKSGEKSELAALIQQRQKGRQETLFDDLQARYDVGKNSNKGTKRTTLDEPPEEAFQKNRKKQARI